MDKIRIRNLEVFANHGVFPEERILGQKFLVSAELHTSMKEAAAGDDLEKAVNYGDVCQFISDYTQDNTFELIETLADRLAREILAGYERVEKVILEVSKPWAPVGLPLENVSVEVERGRHTVYIALGSNMGDKEGYLWRAVDSLNGLEDLKVTKVSDFIVTKPYGAVEQDDFLNGVLEAETTMDPFELLDALHVIENEAGRTREVRWGPRTLDLDIIFYDDMVLDSEKLIIPHKEMHLRDFVLKPLLEIAPWKRHPLLGRTVEELAEEL